MKLRIIAGVVCTILLAVVARASTTVEVVGRVNPGANLSVGPWAGVRVGEYVHVTWEVVPGTTYDPLHAQGYLIVPGTFRMTVRGYTLGLKLNAAGTDPSCILANGYPVSDVFMTQAAGDVLPLVEVGTTTPTVYAGFFELHDSSGTAFNTVDITQAIGTYGPSKFDYVDWNVTGQNGTGFSVSLVSLIFRQNTDSTGSCCLGDGWCATTSYAGCPGSWDINGSCEAAGCVPAGACCLPTGGCELLTRAECEAIPFGVYQGDNTSCATVACPPTGGCCINGSCTVLTALACEGFGGTWMGAGTNCEIQAQYYVPVGANLVDATGGLNGNPVVPGVFSHTIVVSDSVPADGAEVWVDLYSPRVNDLTITVTGPNGAVRTLYRRIGSTPPACTVTPIGPGYAFNNRFIFQDSASQSLFQYVTSLPTNTYVPGGRFRASDCGGTPVVLNDPDPVGFGGISASGTWTLTVTDERPGTYGYLYGWGLSFNGGNPAPCTSPQCSVTCDYNQDGSADTSDVLELADAIASGSDPYPTSCLDYNQDGSADTSDVLELADAVASATCP